MSQIPNGWLINKGVSLETPEKQVSMMIDGINQLPAPLPIFTKTTLLPETNVVVNAKHDQHLCFMGLKLDPVDERGTGAIHRNLHFYDIYHDLPMNLSWDKSKFPTNHTKYVYIYIYIYIYIWCVCV